MPAKRRTLVTCPPRTIHAEEVVPFSLAAAIELASVRGFGFSGPVQGQAESLSQRAELQRQETLLVQQQDRLLNMRLAEDIDQDTFAKKHTELRDRLASIKLQLDAVDRSHDETAELAAKVFELSQTLRNQWLTADYPEKRRLLEIVFLNCRLNDATLVPEMRKPFDVLAEGLLTKNSRGERI